MLVQNENSTKKTLILPPGQRQTCGWICNYIIIQCIVVFVGAFTIVNCIWTPERATQDYDKLVRIMYLFDSQACGYNLRSMRTISNLQLSNDTQGYAVLPIKWIPAIVTVSTRLATKTRRYIEVSIFAHVMWLLIALILKILRDVTNVRLLKLSLAIFFYTSVFIVVFDLSMAIVYIAHIQQSLTKGMILRYSGWSVEMKLKNYEGFGGWLPMVASICWMRGIVFLVLNIYCCKLIFKMRRGIKKTEVKSKLILEENPPIPESKHDESTDDQVLYYRTGEKMPYVRNSYRAFF